MHGFQVTTSFEWWCSVLGSDLCTGYSDLSVPVDWLNLINFEWMVDSIVSEVQWLFDLVVQWLFYVRGFIDLLIQRLMIGFQLYQRLMIVFQWLDVADVFDGCITMVIYFELQCYWWVMYENLMKCGLHIVLLCTRSIQHENLWNMVPGGYWGLEHSVRKSKHLASSGWWFDQGVGAPFQ